MPALDRPFGCLAENLAFAFGERVERIALSSRPHQHGDDRGVGDALVLAQASDCVEDRGPSVIRSLRRSPVRSG